MFQTCLNHFDSESLAGNSKLSTVEELHAEWSRVCVRVAAERKETSRLLKLYPHRTHLADGK